MKSKLILGILLIPSFLLAQLQDIRRGGGAGGGVAATNAINTLNGISGATQPSQTFAVGTTGSDVGISSAGSTHTFNFPNAAAAVRGVLSIVDWTAFNAIARAGSSNVIHVWKHGSDSTGNGSFGTPYSTITNAVARATSGQTVVIGPGDWFMTQARIADGKMLTVMGYGRDATRITGNDTGTFGVFSVSNFAVLDAHHFSINATNSSAKAFDVRVNSKLTLSDTRSRGWSDVIFVADGSTNISFGNELIAHTDGIASFTDGGAQTNYIWSVGNIAKLIEPGPGSTAHFYLNLDGPSFIRVIGGEISVEKTLNTESDLAAAKNETGGAMELVGVKIRSIPQTADLHLDNSGGGTIRVTGVDYDTSLTAGTITRTDQPWDADLDTWATVTPSANGITLVSAADFAAMKDLLGVIETNHNTARGTNWISQVLDIGTPAADDYIPILDRSTATRKYVQASELLGGGGSVGGSDGQLQYNNSGVMDGAAKIIITGESNMLASGSVEAWTMTASNSVSVLGDGAAAGTIAIGELAANGVNTLTYQAPDNMANDRIFKLDFGVTPSAGQSITVHSFSGNTIVGTNSTPAGGGDALTANGLDQFASTTSAELAGVLSDESGTAGGFLRDGGAAWLGLNTTVTRGNIDIGGTDPLIYLGSSANSTSSWSIATIGSVTDTAFAIHQGGLGRIILQAGGVNIDIGGTLRPGTVIVTNLLAKQLIQQPAITVSNLFLSGWTNNYECVGLTNIHLTNIVEEATGVNSRIKVAIRNTLSVSVPVLLPAFGAQHGYFFHTNSNNDVLSATVAPPGTNTVFTLEIDGTNVYPTVTYWRNP